MTKTKDIEANVVEPTSYGFYSKVLEKPFDTLEELKEAEAEHQRIEDEKAAKALARKNEALAVEDAFKALNAARKEYNEKRIEISKAYSEAVAKAKQIAEEHLTDVRTALSDAEEKYSKALKEFSDKHPDGFHLTVRDGDFVKTISSSGKLDFEDPFKPFMDLFNLITF